MSEVDGLNLSDFEREMLGLDASTGSAQALEVTYNYRCLRCQHEDEVPDVVVDGFIASAGLQPDRMPTLVCPECGGPFRAKVAGSSRERSER